MLVNLPPSSSLLDVVILVQYWAATKCAIAAVHFIFFITGNYWRSGEGESDKKEIALLEKKQIRGGGESRQNGRWQETFPPGNQYRAETFLHAWESNQPGRGHWTDNFTCTQSFNLTVILFVGSKTLATLIEF